MDKIKIPGKTHIVFAALISLLTIALVVKKLMLPFSSTVLTIAFDAAAVSFFIRAFIVMSKDQKIPNMKGIQLNVMPITFCISTLALLIRLENWRGWHAWTKVAFILLLLILIPFLTSVKDFFQKKKGKELAPIHAETHALNTAQKKQSIEKLVFTFFIPWIYFFVLISISVFSNPRQFYDMFNGSTYEQYARQRYSQALATQLIEKYKPADEASAIKAADYFTKGKELEAKENYDDALISYNKAIDLNPDHAEAIYHRGLLKLTRLELTRERAEEAINDFSRAIELKPDYAAAYYHRAVANNFLTHGNNTEAKQDLKKALELDSTLQNDKYLQETLKK